MYADELEEVRRREAELGVEPDAEIDAFMAACGLRGKRHSMATAYVLRMLGLEICADVKVGSALIRGISGGQRKRLTVGEGQACMRFCDLLVLGILLLHSHRRLRHRHHQSSSSTM